MKQTATKLTRLLLAFAILVFPLFTLAQNTQVNGKIIDASSGKPIDGQPSR
jgi:hypothetical protein